MQSPTREVRPLRSRLAHIITALAVLGVVTFGAIAPSAAQTSNDPSPEPVSDFENWPLGFLPESCRTEGPDALTNVRFSVDGGPEVPDLRQLNLEPPAQAVTMRWDGFAEGCEDVGISLSIKNSGSVQFDPNQNQYGFRTAYCGPEPGMISCTAPFELTLFLAPEVGDPAYDCFQVDASMGPPLAVVGPDGSFYGSLNGVFNTLISAWNGGITPCGIPQPPTSTTTTTAPPPPPGQQTTTTTPPGTSATDLVCPPDQQVVDGVCTAVAGQTVTLPATGPEQTTSTTATGGFALIAIGGLLAVGGGLLGRRSRS
ncbi:MAG: hypothetical protein S0880_30450 [Actinomycetota bacterium]|nr:hypothetical protein [Actinomycetota bacterium]